MAYKKFSQIKTFLQKFHPEFPILLFYGNNYGLTSHNAETYVKLSAAYLNIPDDNFSIVKFYAHDLNPGQIFEEIKTPSFLSKAKILWVKEVNNNFTSETKHILNNSFSDVIIVLEAKELKPNSSLRKTIEQASNAIALPCLLDDDNNLSEFIDKSLQNYNLKIEPQTKRFLLNLLKSDFLLAKSELEKLCLYCAQKSTIALEDINNICIDINIIDLYKIVDYMMLGKLREFNIAYSHYIKNGMNSALILQIALKQFKELLSFKEKPPINIHFKRQQTIEQLLNIWGQDAIIRALAFLQKQNTQARVNNKLKNLIVQNSALTLARYAQKPKTRF